MEWIADTSWNIQLHWAMAMLALLMGAMQLALPKGGALHRLVGRIWVALVFMLSLVSLGIHELMPNGFLAGYSPIHLLSVYVMFQVVRGIRLARQRRFQEHAKCMTSLYWIGLVLAGVFTFYPGRLLYRVWIEPLWHWAM